MNFLKFLMVSAVSATHESQFELSLLNPFQSSTDPQDQCSSSAERPLEVMQDLEVDGFWGKNEPCACIRTKKEKNAFWTAHFNDLYNVREVQVLTKEFAQDNFGGS